MGIAGPGLIPGPALLAALAFWPPPTAAPVAPADPPVETMAFVADVTARMTVPVSIGGRGPYRFIVDTGAERTVVSQELARTLALGPGRMAVVHSMTETQRIPTVIVSGLQVGARRMADIHAPAFAQRDIGAAGLLGVDSLQRATVDFDFLRREMTIAPSRRRAPRWDGDTIVITARSRFGRLILVDASLDGERVYVVIDTGAQVTVGNTALRRRLERRGRLGQIVPITLYSVTGGTFAADAAVARRIRLSGIEISNLPVAFADVPPFRLLGLDDRPAILLGMDGLGLFARVSVDFANRRVRLMPPPGTDGAEPERLGFLPP